MGGTFLRWSNHKTAHYGHNGLIGINSHTKTFYPNVMRMHCDAITGMARLVVVQSIQGLWLGSQGSYWI